MKLKRYSAEQIIGKLREVEGLLSQRSGCSNIFSSVFQCIPVSRKISLLPALPRNTRILMSVH